MSEVDPDSRPKGKSLKPLQMLLPFLAPHKGVMALAILALLLSSAALLAMPMAVKNVIDYGFTVEDAANVDRYFVILLFFAMAIGFFGALRAYFVYWLGERVVADLRSKVFRHVIYMDPSFFETTKMGEVLSRLTADTTLIQSISGVGVSIVLRSSIQFVGGLLLLAVTNLKLMAILIVLLPLILVPILFLGRWLRQLSRDSQDRVADASGHAAEALGNASTVQSFNAESQEAGRFSASVEQSFSTAIKRNQIRALLTMVATASVFGALIFVLWLGAKDVLTGQITGGELGQFVLYALFVGTASAGLIEVWGDIQRAAGAMERLSELLLMQPAITQPERPVPLPVPSRGQVAFKRVSFSYPSRPDEYAINEFNIIIDPGEHVAFVGPSGAGKSTLFQLLLRFYDPQSGSIEIDGIDIRSALTSDLRSRCAIVPQDCIIFGESAMDNIRFGRPGASDDEVIRAATSAYADDFLRNLPQGYDTYLGEKGARLSGGQRQRIAIARAIIADPPILLLDEATSSLDSESEYLIQNALEKLQEHRTTLVIAHRLATVRKADRIILMDQGRIIEAGTHEQLLGSSEHYAHMVELQFGPTAPQPQAVEPVGR